MSTTQVEKPLKRTTGYGQRHIETRLKLGRYTVLHWESIKTDMDQFDRS